jgi:hypothetical protein
MDDDLDTLLKRFVASEVGEAVARENVVLNRPLLLRRLSVIDRLCEAPEWNASKYIKFRAELLAYLAEGRKLIGYTSADKRETKN